MNEGAALRVLSFLNDTSERHLASLAKEKRKVTVIGEENEPDELQEEPSTDVIDADTTLLSSEQIKEFFKAVEDGSIERLDELFDTLTDVDPNITQYTESLLMAAIRAKRPKVAEYLIDQLAVNVNYSTDLIEFRTITKIPIRERILSCRELAYEKGMMELVDLIDIASDEVKPSIKRYLQRRLKTRLQEIQQSYLKRMKERNNRLIIQSQERQNQLLEEDELENDNEPMPTVKLIDEIGLPSPLPPPPPPIIRRPFKSHIEETIQKIESKNDKSIDETGKKTFRFSNYSLRYRLVETDNSNQQANKPSRPKTAPFSLPTLPQPSTVRPLTTASRVLQRSSSDITTRIPVRETRTSICRSARRIVTPRTSSISDSEIKSEVKPATAIHTTQRLLPKRMHSNNRTYGYIPQIQQVVYSEPRQFVPITLKATAFGLPSNTRLIRD